MRSKRAIRDEKGQTLVMVLILLLIGGLIIGPLLSYMGTGLITGNIYEKRTDELYSADAGVEDAIWKIQNNDGYLPCNPGSEPRNYTILDVNGKSIEVSIDYAGEGTYKITSIAATDDDGNTAAIDSATTIEAYLSVSYLDLSSLLDNAIVSQYTIDIQPGTEINGDIWLPDEDDLELPPPHQWSHNGTVKDEDDGLIIWPTAEQLSSYYWDDVKHLEEEAYPDGYVMNIPPEPTEEDPYPIGPLLADGDLTIKGDGWIRLEGTIYVKGNLNFNPTPAINIDLNKQTIFAEGEIHVNPGVTIYGSGCIIAIDYVDFQPMIASAEDEFVLVMSITDEVWFHPNGDFTGCIAGDANVQLSPGGTINWIDPEGMGLDFPMGVGDDDELPPVTGVSIEYWEVIRLSPDDLGE